MRGTTSHFNNATPLDAALFQIMGSFIVLVWLMGLLTAGLLIAQRLPDVVFGWSLRLGWLLGRAGRLPVGHRTGLMVTAGMTYLGVVVLLAWQALHGESVIAPDALTLSGFGLLLGLAGVLATLIVARPARVFN